MDKNYGPENDIETYGNVKYLCDGRCSEKVKKLCFRILIFILNWKFEDQFLIINFRI